MGGPGVEPWRDDACSYPFPGYESAILPRSCSRHCSCIFRQAHVLGRAAAWTSVLAKSPLAQTRQRKQTKPLGGMPALDWVTKLLCAAEDTHAFLVCSALDAESP